MSDFEDLGPITSIPQMVTKIAQEEGVHPVLAHNIARNESGFNPWARSPKGAMGVMQLMPGTAQDLGVRNPWDPEQNIRAGLKYYKGLEQQFRGNPVLAVAAYNAGPGAVNKYGGVPPYQETRKFVNNVLGLSLERKAGARAAKPSAKFEDLGPVQFEDLGPEIKPTAPNVHATESRIPLLTPLKKAAEEWGGEIGKSVEVPVEAAFGPESLAVEFARGKGLSGETVKMPLAPAGLLPPAWFGPLSPLNIVPKAVREETELQVGKLPGGKEPVKDVPIDPAALGVPSGEAEYPSPAKAAGVAAEQATFAAQFGVPKILGKIANLPIMGKAPAPTVESLKVAATQQKVAGKLQKSLTRGLEQYGGEAPPGVSALEQAPWKKTVKVEKTPKLPEIPPETPVELTTVNSLKNMEQGVAIQNNPVNYNFRRMAQAIIPETPRGTRGIEPPPPPSGAATRLNPVPPAFEKDLLPLLDTELRSSNLVAADRWTMTNNPVVDWFDGMLNYFDRRIRGEGWLNNVVKFVPNMARDIRESVRSGQKLLTPLFERFVDLNAPREEITRRMAALSRQVRDPESAAGKAIIAEVEALAKQKKDYLKSIRPQLAGIYRDRQLIIDYLASKYANVRIKMAAGGNDKYLPLMSDAEKEAARVTRKYYDLKKGELKNQGLWTKEEDYVNFLFGNPLTSTGRGLTDTGALSFVKGLWYGRRKITPTLLDFMHRTPGAKDWFPFWYQSMKSYIPSVERKLSFNPYLMKWVPEAESWSVQYPRAYKWFNDFQKKNFGGEEVNTLNRMVNGLINVEYARTLAGNLAVPVLHAFKLFQTPMYHGFVPTLKGAYRYGKGIAQMLVRNPGMERQILEYYVPMQRLTRAIEQQPGMGKLLKPSFWKRASMFLTPIIEHLDNGVNVMANMSRGVRGGFDPRTTHMMNLDTLMRLNFTGFSMPPAFSGTGGRTAFMYMGQPWKILENKIDFLVKGLQGKRDEFGGAYFWKMLRAAAIVGVGIQAGKSVGVDLWKHFGHFPGEAMTRTGEETISFETPPMQLAHEIKEKGIPKGLYGHFTNVPGLDRAIRLSKGEIKPGFTGPWLQTFGFKEPGWKEEYQRKTEKFARQQEKRERKSRTPTQELIDNILGR